MDDMTTAKEFLNLKGFNEEENYYWYNMDGEALLEALADASNYYDECEFVEVTLTDGVKQSVVVGWMFADDSMILDYGDVWITMPPSWEREDGISVVEYE